MRKPVVLITGAAGEIGHALIDRLAEEDGASLVTLDLQPLDPKQARKVARAVHGSILDGSLLDQLQAEYAVDRVYHLAALLSTRSEFTPMAAHEVNVRGTLNLLEFAMGQARSHGRSVAFFYPSSIAAYGVPPEMTGSTEAVTEERFNHPITMYGCNKLYCEHLGDYYAHHYKQLDAEDHAGRVDFRSIRFPGLISALTVPSGGTSDYAPEMIHAAAQQQPYACFVRPDTRIPFMAMPDAVDAILQLMRTPAEALQQDVYNIGAFNPTAAEIRDVVLRAFPEAEIAFAPDIKRQAIVDSWPGAVDDRAAREQWGFAPEYDLGRAFSDYLIPTISRRYAD
jgi:threonine 3-dehydrogenase